MGSGNAPRDVNRVPTLIGVSNSGLTTAVPVAVDPSTHRLLVQATVGAGTSYIGKVRLTDGTNDSTLRSLTNAKPLDVSIVDGAGDQITSFGGGTQYATGAAQATPVGTVSLGWDGANVKALPLDASGFLKVNVAAGGASGGTSSTFGSAFPGTGTAAGFKDSTGTNLAAGNLNAAGALKVDNSAVTQPVSAVSLPLPTGAAADATLTGGTQQTKLTDGTNIANVLKGDGSAAGQNAQLIGSAFQSQAFSVAAVAAGTSYDVGGYSWVSVHVLTQYTGTTPTITWQGSNDNTNWVGLALIQPLSTLSSGSLNTTAANVLYAGPIHFRYFRLNFTGAYTSGAATGVVLFSTTPRQTVNINGQVALNGTSAVDTELPAAAALSDTTANPTAPMVGAGGMVWDAINSQWVRARQAEKNASSITVGAQAVGLYAADGTNMRAVVTPSTKGDADAGNGAILTGAQVYNGSTYDRQRGDATNGAWVNVKATAAPASLFNNQGTVTTAGTRVQLGTNTVAGVIIQALSTNTSSIWVGSSAVSASNGFELQPGQATSAAVSNTNLIWVDATTNGDKFCWIAS